MRSLFQQVLGAQHVMYWQASLQSLLCSPANSAASRRNTVPRISEVSTSIGHGRL